MRKLQDIRCLECHEVELDKYVDLDEYVHTCGGRVERVVLATHALGRVIGDDIPGGVLVEHGICNEDGTPKRYYSKTEIREACARKGFTWGYDKNEHIPKRGSDHSPFTSRWV